MEMAHSQHGGLPAGPRQNYSSTQTVKRALPPSSRGIGLPRPSVATTATRRGAKNDREQGSNLGRRENENDGVVRESKGKQGNVRPDVTPPRPSGQKRPRALFKLVEDKKAARTASTQSNDNRDLLPSASLISIATATGSSPELPTRATSSRSNMAAAKKTSRTSRSTEENQEDKGPKKRKSGQSKEKSQGEVPERTPSGASDTRFGEAFFDKIAQADDEFAPLSPLRTAHSSQTMPDEAAQEFFNTLKIEKADEASRRSKREKEAEKRRSEKEEVNRKQQDEKDRLDSRYFWDIKQDGETDRDFAHAISVYDTQYSEAAIESSSLTVSPRKKLRPESEVERTLICQFCSGDLPQGFEDREYHRLRYRLEVMSVPATNPDYSFSRELEWSKRIDFCSWHQALTTVIPEGRTAGYPDKIDFLSIPDRLEEGWLRKELEGLVKYPLRSKKWQEYSKMIDQAGRSKWKIAQLREPEIVLSQHVGYYGMTGRSIIADHLQSLVKWGYFPTLSLKPGEISIYDPMTCAEFIEHILVPEAGILLIMDDLGRDTIKSAKGKAEARSQAENVWKESREYGRWQFKESKRSTKIEAKVRERKGEIKEMVSRMRQQSKRSRKKREDSSASVRRKQEEPISIDDSSDDGSMAVKRRSVEKISSPAIRKKDQAILKEGDSVSSGHSGDTLHVVLVDSSLGSQLNHSVRLSQRSLAKTESFDSGYGEAIFEAMDYGAIDDLCPAKMRTT